MGGTPSGSARRVDLRTWPPRQPPRGVLATGGDTLRRRWLPRTKRRRRGRGRRPVQHAVVHGVGGGPQSRRADVDVRHLGVRLRSPAARPAGGRRCPGGDHRRRRGPRRDHPIHRLGRGARARRLPPGGGAAAAHPSRHRPVAAGAGVAARPRLEVLYTDGAEVLYDYAEHAGDTRRRSAPATWSWCATTSGCSTRSCTPSCTGSSTPRTATRS